MNLIETLDTIFIDDLSSINEDTISYSYPTVHDDDGELINKLNIKKYNAVVAGGAALRWYQRQPVESHDVDIWFNNQEDFDKMNSSMIMSHALKVNTVNANTYEVTIGNTSYKVQLIKPKNEYSPQELVESFDISVTQVATDGNRWYVGKYFIEDLKHRKLRLMYNNPKSIRRLIKYWVYGYTPDDATLLSIINNPETVWDYQMSTQEDYEDGI